MRCDLQAAESREYAILKEIKGRHRSATR